LIATAALQQYADRGVFRGLGITKRTGGRYEYVFTWLMRRPFTLTYDPARRLFTFNDLFPGVEPRSRIAAVLRRLVAERSTRSVPAHKRLDTRKVRAACAVRRGRFALTMRVISKGAKDEEYAVRHLLNLVNEMFLALQETYPDYLIAHFGLSSE
jgi:hypothetical protein